MRALDDSDPRLIGRFAVLGLLGAGGMGRVYLARPVHGPDPPDALVALKVVRPELADDGPFRERFRREVAAAARVNALFTAEVVDGRRMLLADLGGSVIRDMELVSMLSVRTAVLDPQDVAESPDGRQLFVPNGRANTVTVVDPVAGRAGAVVQVGQFPTAATVSPDGTRVYVTNTGSDTVSVLDTATAQVVATVPVGDAPSDVAASPDGAWIYIADNGSGTVTVIDAATGTVAATVPVGVSPVALAVAPDSSRVYVVDRTADTITLLQRP